jgi:UDP-N-acetylmuramoylalanine--D-glutamate ligase
MTFQPPFDFSGKRVVVIGMARSGLAAAEVLSERGAQVRLIDSKPASDLAEALEFARSRGISALPDTQIAGDVDLIVTSPGVPASAPVLQDASRRGLPVWGEIEAAYRLSPAPILAITGTNGKTTTTALLGEIAREAGYRTFVGGNIAAGSLALPLIRAADQARPEDVIVAEISSFQLEWIDAFRPKVAAILNITTDHLDRQTWEEYLASKWRIVENQGVGDTAVLRSDVPLAPAGTGPKGDVVLFDQEPRPDWLTDIRLPGEHNRENVMAAHAMALAFGIGEDAIRAASLRFNGVVHRLEYVATIGGARWINNSMCTNNDAFARSLAAIDGPKIVIAGGVFKGGDTTELARAALDPSVRTLLFFGKSGPMLGQVAREAGAQACEVFDTMAEAVSRARSLASPGDTVMLSPACASFDQFKNFEDRGDQFKAQAQLGL